MAVTTYQQILMFIMYVAGLYTIISKNWLVGMESTGSDGTKRKFDHPFVQCWLIFLGGILCFIVFKIILKYFPEREVIDVQEFSDPTITGFNRITRIGLEEVELIRGNRDFNPLLFFPPAMLCMIATPVMYVGLTYSPSYQALLAPSIICVALLSRRSLQTLSIVVMMIGLLILNLGNLLGSKDEPKDMNGLITGVLLIIIAQIITTFQIVYEEKFLVDEDIPPLQAVGWEGIFGFIVSSLLFIPLYFIKVGYPFAENSRGVLEDFPDAMIQIYNNPWFFLSCIEIVISSAFYNFAAISLTKEMSAATRVIINIFTCLLFQEFHIPQIIGFIVVLSGGSYHYRNLSSASSSDTESSLSETSEEREEEDAEPKPAEPIN